jgi:hypothetical protein
MGRRQWTMKAMTANRSSEPTAIGTITGGTTTADTGIEGEARTGTTATATGHATDTESKISIERLDDPPE